MEKHKRFSCCGVAAEIKELPDPSGNAGRRLLVVVCSICGKQLSACSQEIPHTEVGSGREETC